MTRSFIDAAGDRITLAAGAGELALLGGTQVRAGGDIALSGPSVRIEALRDTNFSSSSTRGGSVTVSGAGVAISGNYSQSRTQGENFTSASVTAGGNLSIATQGDLTVRGGSLRGATVDVAVGGALTLESVQDTSRSRSVSVSGGITIGPGGVLPSSLGYGQGSGRSATTDAIAEIIGTTRTTVTVGGAASLVGATILSQSGDLTFTAQSLTVRDLADSRRQTGFNIGVTGLDALIGTPATPTPGGNPVIGGITAGYNNFAASGTTFTVIGAGTITIGGELNPAVLATVKRDLDGRQVFTVTDKTNFTIDIPLVNLQQLTANATSALNLVKALTTPVPEAVRSTSPEAADYFQRLIAGGSTPEAAEAFVTSQQFIDTTTNIRAVREAAANPNADPRIVARMDYLIAQGIKVGINPDGTAYALACNATSSFCNKIGIDPSQPISGDKLREVISGALNTLAQLQQNGGSREDMLLTQSQLHSAVRCALAFSVEGGTLEQERQLLTANRDLIVAAGSLSVQAKSPLAADRVATSVDLRLAVLNQDEAAAEQVLATIREGKERTGSNSYYIQELFAEATIKSLREGDRDSALQQSAGLLSTARLSADSAFALAYGVGPLNGPQVRRPSTQFETTSAVDIRLTSATRTAPEYEAAIRERGANAPPGERRFQSPENGKIVNREADDVVRINGRPTAVDAKFVKDWDLSLANPNSPIGSREFAIKQQNEIVEQAMAYSKNFPGGAIYHTNSPEFATYYNDVFKQAGIRNITFKITPVKGQ